MLAVIFQCFFNLHSCTFKDSISPVLVLKKKNFKILVKSRNFGHLDFNQQNCILFYWYFYAEWKTVVTHKCSSKMFVYSQDDKRLYKCLNEYGGTFTEIFMITIQGYSQYIQDIFYWIQRVALSTFLPQSHWLMAVWTWEAETRVS